MGSSLSEEEDPNIDTLIVRQQATLQEESSHFFGRRPLQQPSLWISNIVKNPVHVHPKTVSVSHRETHPVLQFSFDAVKEGTVIVHRAAVLVFEPDGWSVKSAAWSSPPCDFESGLGQTHFLEWEDLPPVQQALAPGHRNCPLLIELREVGTSPSIEWTSFRVHVDRFIEVEILSQQLQCAGHFLELHDVYGSEMTDGHRQDCIVCQSEPRDTAVMPCRHLCLCSACSDYIRSRVQYHSYKCPLCRERITRMMRFDRDEAS